MSDQLAIVTDSEEYVKAKTLINNIKSSAKLAEAAIYEFCKGVMELRDGKHYKALGYANFEECCEKEIGMSRPHAYKYIDIAETYSEDDVYTYRQIGLTKLALLTKMSEYDREKLLEENDVNTISVRDLKKQVKDLQADNLAHDKAYKKLSGEKDRLAAEILTKEKQISELENRPTDIAVVDNSEELENLKSAYETEIENIKAGYEKKLTDAKKTKPSFAEGSSSEVDVFKTLFGITYDSFNKLLDFVSKAGAENKSLFAEKIKTLAEALNRAAEGV
jgi:hypothetical protein